MQKAGKAEEAGPVAVLQRGPAAPKNRMRCCSAPAGFRTLNLQVPAPQQLAANDHWIARWSGRCPASPQGFCSPAPGLRPYSVAGNFQLSKLPGPGVCFSQRLLLEFSTQHADASALKLSRLAAWLCLPCAKQSLQASPSQMGLCNFIRRIFAGSAQKQPPQQEPDQLVPAATKFGLATILETRAVPASDFTSTPLSLLTDTAAQPHLHPTSLACSPRASTPPATVCYQGHFGVHDSVPTLADCKEWSKLPLSSDMFRTTQAWDAASDKYWAWVSENSHELFLAEKEAFTESKAFMADLRQQRSALHKSARSRLAACTHSLFCCIQVHAPPASQ